MNNYKLDKIINECINNEINRSKKAEFKKMLYENIKKVKPELANKKLISEYADRCDEEYINSIVSGKKILNEIALGALIKIVAVGAKVIGNQYANGGWTKVKNAVGKIAGGGLAAWGIANQIGKVNKYEIGREYIDSDANPNAPNRIKPYQE